MPAKREVYFLELINQHKGLIYKVARMYADLVEDREDLVQEIILRLWQSFEHFEGRSAFSTWMYRVAVNTAITFLRKEKKKPHQVEIELPSVQNKMDEAGSTDDNRLELFYKAVQQLNAVEKALIFYFMEGLSHREISQLLGLTEVNTRVKLARTKEKLQNIIKTYGYEP